MHPWRMSVRATLRARLRDVNGRRAQMGTTQHMTQQTLHTLTLNIVIRRAQVDIEGQDLVCLKSLREIAAEGRPLPPYVTAEDNRAIDVLSELGYDRF